MVKNNKKGKKTKRTATKKKGKKKIVSPKYIEKKTRNKSTKKKSTGSKKDKIKTDSERREIWKKNLILGVIVILLTILNLWLYLPKKKTKENLPPAGNVNKAETQDQKEQKEAATEENYPKEKIKEADITNWKTYRNTLYNFELKYPEDWSNPVVVRPTRESKYQFKVSLRDKADSESGQRGFDVLVYRYNKPVGYFSSSYSDNLIIKDSAAADFSNCKELDVISLGANNYSAVKVLILPDDPCFSETYFFSFRRGSRMLEIVPIPSSGTGYAGYDGEKKVQEDLPEFSGILSTLNFPTVVKTVNSPMSSGTVNKPAGPTNKVAPPPKPKPKSKPAGIRCPEHIQHPKASPNKGKHVDEDCCPDPDEYPRAGCAYSSHDFSIMLKGKPK